MYFNFIFQCNNVPFIYIIYFRGSNHFFKLWISYLITDSFEKSLIAIFLLISYIPCFQTSSHKSYSRNSFIFGVYHFLIKITPLLHEYVNDVNENSSYTEIPTSSYKKPGAGEHPKQSVIHSWSFNSIYQRKIVSIILSQLQKLNRKMPAGKIIYYFFFRNVIHQVWFLFRYCPFCLPCMLQLIFFPVCIASPYAKPSEITNQS